MEYCEITGSTGATNSYGIYTTTSTGNIFIRNTIVNGGTAASYSYGIYSYSEGNSIIEFSDINGGAADYSYGFFQPSSIASSSLVITNCSITGGSGTTRTQAVTLNNNSAPSPYVYNNIIIAGSNPSYTPDTYAIWLGQGSSPVIANNTISADYTTDNSYGVYTAYGAQPYIYNNIFILSFS